MLVFQPLRHRRIALLWGGQVLSNVGDEVYKVAMVWLATGLIGTRAGYLSALQAGAGLFFGLTGGIWADRRDPRRTLIGVDLVRGVAVLFPPVLAIWFPPSLWVLIPVVLVVSSMSAFFDPALRTVFPEVAKEKELLQATNGLMETTGRFARVVGPGMVALLNQVVPILQFFTIDAASFFLSALSLAWLKRELPADPGRHTVPRNLKENLFRGARLVWSHPLLRFSLATSGLVVSAWYLVFPLALALRLRQEMPGNLGALGLILAGYGIGNLTSNLIVGSLPMNRVAFWHFGGRVVLGVGFLALATTTTVPGMMAASALAAIGGPMTDISFLVILQRDFRGVDIARIYRFGLSTDYACLLIVFLISPRLFEWASVSTLIALCGATMLVPATLGCWLFRLDQEKASIAA